MPLSKPHRWSPIQPYGLGQSHLKPCPLRAPCSRQPLAKAHCMPCYDNIETNLCLILSPLSQIQLPLIWSRIQPCAIMFIRRDEAIWSNTNACILKRRRYNESHPIVKQVESDPAVQALGKALVRAPSIKLLPAMEGLILHCPLLLSPSAVASSNHQSMKALPSATTSILRLVVVFYKYTYSNILTNLDYRAEDVSNLARVQIDRVLGTRRSQVPSARSICTRARLLTSEAL